MYGNWSTYLQRLGRAAWQWQPTTTSHDPSPPITAENPAGGAISGVLSATQAIQTSAIAAVKIHSGAITASQVIQASIIAAVQIHSGTIGATQVVQSSTLAALLVNSGSIAATQVVQASDFVGGQIFSGVIVGDQPLQTSEIAASQAGVVAPKEVVVSYGGVGSSRRRYINFRYKLHTDDRKSHVSLRKQLLAEDEEVMAVIAAFLKVAA